jgi:hypothetical protein
MHCYKMILAIYISFPGTGHICSHTFFKEFAKNNTYILANIDFNRTI